MSYQKKEDDGPKTSDWKGCTAQTCPIPPSVSSGGNQYCTFHFGSEYAEFDGITQAIRHNLEHYNYYRKVSKWNIKEWMHGVNALRGYQYCPIEDHETVIPGPYIDRFMKTIRKRIKDDANNGAR